MLTVNTTSTNVCIVCSVITQYVYFRLLRFFAESLPSVGGQIIPPEGYFQKVAE